MTDRPLTKLKLKIKRLLGRIVYIYVYTKNKLKDSFDKSSPTSKSTKKHLKNLLLTNKRGRLITGILTFILLFYYGLGAYISSDIENRLDNITKYETKKTPHTLSALSYVLKIQVDKQAWTPSLPIIFPASVLDNLPNFQLGVKDSANYFIKKLAKHYQNQNLEDAGKLLDYDPTIWLFSQTKDDKLAPGSAKQYRKALALIETTEHLSNSDVPNSPQDLLYTLKSTNILLKKELNKLQKHIQEHHSEILDFRADNAFYHAQGVIYTIHYFLSGVAKDFQSLILYAEQYENMTSALKALSEASELRPLIIKNTSPNSTYEANHLLYLAYYLSKAQNYLQEIYFNILLKTTELPQ